jgi:dihydropyrimidine dehydrogenase (NAD+) subunit PreA
VSLINTINSIMGVDPDTLTMTPATGGKGSHGGYCGPAVKPIALNMVAEIAARPRPPACRFPASAAWAAGATRWTSSRWAPAMCRCAPPRWSTVSRSCRTWPTACRTGWTTRAYTSIEQFRGRALPTVTDWQHLNLNTSARR